MSIRIASKNNRAIRIENIPQHSQHPQHPVDPLDFFELENRDKLVVKSIAPAVHVEDGDEVEFVATLAARSADVDFESLSLNSDEVTLDYDFHGFTPLNAPIDPVAEYVMLLCIMTSGSEVTDASCQCHRSEWCWATSFRHFRTLSWSALVAR